jgi:hypothetical protein
MINRCGMCKSSEEIVDHLLLHCEVASTLWDAIFSHFGVAWVMPRHVVDLLACWWSSGGAKECCGLEDGVYLPFLVLMARKEQ